MEHTPGDADMVDEYDQLYGPSTPLAATAAQPTPSSSDAMVDTSNTIAAESSGPDPPENLEAETDAIYEASPQAGEVSMSTVVPSQSTNPPPNGRRDDADWVVVEKADDADLATAVSKSAVEIAPALAIDACENGGVALTLDGKDEQTVAGGIAAPGVGKGLSDAIGPNATVPASDIVERDGNILVESSAPVKLAATDLTSAGPATHGDVPIIEPPATTHPSLDPAFLAAAEANRADTEAEWQYDSSDMDTSSDDSDSDSSSSDDSDEAGDGYQMMDPAEAARMLMADGGGDDEDDHDKGTANKGGIRSKNEVAEVVIPKPDVKVTPDMEVLPLGKVDNVVENLVLIKGFNSGEYRVLEPGSVLCLQDLSVIGVIADTFGRVQQPMYSVAFTNAEEIEEAKVFKDVTISYVAPHSTFVFTEPLKGLRGTDASNIHDEEVGVDEMEFSDDEAEAAAKKAAKMAKRGGRGGFADASAPPASYESTNFGRRVISYDDDDAADGYTPLARQTDMSSGASSAPYGQRPGSSDGRGRGRGRGRGGRGGRGDRGRGRGDFRGGRGGQTRQGPSNSFPDQHNQSYGAPSAQNTWPGQSNAPPPPPPQSQYSGWQQPQAPPAWPQHAQYPQTSQTAWPQQTAQAGQTPSWMNSIQQPYQSNGRQQQYQQPQQYQQQAQPQQYLPQQAQQYQQPPTPVQGQNQGQPSLFPPYNPANYGYQGQPETDPLAEYRRQLQHLDVIRRISEANRPPGPG